MSGPIAAVLVIVLAGAASTYEQVAEPTRGIVLLLVDDLHFEFRSTPGVRSLLIQRVLPAVMREGQALGIVTTGYSSVTLAPTTDRELALARLRTITGGGLRPDGIIDERGAPERLRRAGVSLATAKDVIGYLAARSPSRKSILFLSDGYGDPSLTLELDEIAAAAYRASATIYVVDLHGLLAAAPELTAQQWLQWDAHRVTAQDGLRRLAESTGGLLIWTWSDLDAALEQIASP